MANIDNAFRIEKLSIDDNVLIVEGTNDPTILDGYEAPIGSLYLRSTGELYQKVGTADVDWSKLATTAGSSSEVFNDMNEPTGFLNRTSSEISFNEGTRQFTISPLAPSTSFVYYIKGVKHTISTTKTYTISNTTGTYFIYFDGTENLNSQTTFTPELLTDNAIVAIIYWNATFQQGVYVADERHGISMDGQTHVHLHLSFGCTYINGLTPGNLLTDQDGSSDTHAQLSITNGNIRDEDLNHYIADTGTGVAVYDLIQELAPVGSFPVYYRIGVDWVKRAGASFPFIYSGDSSGYTGTSGRPAFNDYNGSTWGLTEVDNNKYFLVHLFATNDINDPIIAVCGIDQYQNKPHGQEAGQLELGQLSGLPFAEFFPLATLIVQTADSFSNNPKAAFVTDEQGLDFIDWRELKSLSAITNNMVVDHGTLTGLLDDDHPQYLNETRGDLRYYTQTQADILFASQSEIDNVEASIGPNIINGLGVWQGFIGTNYLDAATSIQNAFEILDSVGFIETASNVGVGGVGLFDTKNGTTLEFKNINAGSTKISITDDPTNHEVDIDVVEANISHLNISNIGTNTHAQIDTHIADTTIHFTTLDGISDVVLTAPVSGQYLSYNGTNWVNVTPTSGNGPVIVQCLHGTIPAVSGTAIIPLDATTPQITEGVQLWTRTMTPASVDSNVRITMSLAFSVSNAASNVIVAVFRDNVCIGSMADNAANNNGYQTVSFGIYDQPNTTSPVTYQARFGRGTGNATWYVNSDANGNTLGGTLAFNAYFLQEILM